MKFSSIKRALVPAIGKDMPALPLCVAQEGYPPALRTPDLSLLLTSSPSDPICQSVKVGGDVTFSESISVSKLRMKRVPKYFTAVQYVVRNG